MNKLEEYRNDLAEKQVESDQDVQNDSVSWQKVDETFCAGFDTAIALDLPIKFALWYNSKEQSWKEWRRTVYWIVGEEGVKEAYKYWIDNIYKPE